MPVQNQELLQAIEAKYASQWWSHRSWIVDNWFNKWTNKEGYR